MKVQRSIAALVGAGVVSAATHVAGLTTAWSKPDIEMEGGAPITVARLGDSFRDVAIGELSAQVPEDTEQTNPVEDVQTPIDPQDRAEPVQPDQQTPMKTQSQTRSVAADTRVARLDPQPSTSTDAVVPTATSATLPDAMSSPLQSVQPQKPTPTKSVETAALKPAEPLINTPSAQSTTPLDAVSSLLQPVQPQKPTPAKPDVTATLKPVEPLTKTPPEPTSQALQAEPNADEPAPRLSKRPSKRPREIVTAKPKPQAKPPAKSKPKSTAKAAPKGNGNTAERAGSAQGTATAKANQAGKKPGKKAKQSGNAAVSNYPGAVMRKIQRRKPRTNIRGTAVVSFAIAANGSLARLALVQSSGSAALDKLALTAVQRAAPFPKPPAGAQRSFRLPVKGR